MPGNEPTQEEADKIIAEPKIISGNVQWQPDGRGFRLKEVQVLGTETGTVLRLRGWVGLRNRSVVLLFNNFPIRKWTAHERHRLPDGKIIQGPHKHVWDDEWQDEMAYVPDDVQIGDPMTELQDFLVECNVTLLGGIQPLPWFWSSSDE